MPPVPPLRLLLDGDALVANWRALARAAGEAACGAAIKADGYGLGARAVLARLAAAGARDFFVATWAEAAALEPLPDGVRLGVLHGLRAEDVAAAQAGRAYPVLNTPAQVARWRDAGDGRPCAVMIDTGMNRLGLAPADAPLVDGLPGLTSVFSHLACAEDAAHPLNARQLGLFRDVRARFPAARASLANSAGIALGADYAFDLVRPGLALYGGVPTPALAPVVRPVVALAGEVLQVRAVPAGASVGYGATWVAPRPSRIAILNLGYADGLGRALAGALVARAGWRVAGRISMDLLALDVTGGAVAEGDWIAFDFDLAALAAAADRSPYELLTALGTRFDRRWG